MKKRILSILLLCSMVLTMLPTSAFAAVSDSLGNTPEENHVTCNLKRNSCTC